MVSSMLHYLYCIQFIISALSFVFHIYTDLVNCYVNWSINSVKSYCRYLEMLLGIRGMMNEAKKDVSNAMREKANKGLNWLEIVKLECLDQKID